ncbi:hypothetical protein, partial [Streptomyces plicatus]|uniref:hypothetical protein n=1 Tax=Streptomyces plicatus TaxID=1922 RepID=UPI001C6FD1BF
CPTGCASLMERASALGNAAEVGERGSPLGPTLSRPEGKACINIFCVGVPDFLFYLELQVVIRRSTFASKKEINFFQVFHCTYI